MEKNITNFLERYELLNSDKAICVGFSGGFDSMALMAVLINLSKVHGFKVTAAHLNHNWRGAHSDDDEQNCREFCLKNGIDFYTEKLSNDVPKTETAAREERYAFFERAADYFSTDVILTAHTKSDNAETVLYRIAKGTGVNGLCGVQEVRNCGKIKVFRPLLDVTRSEIENYCRSYNLAPNNDESNADIEFNRNYIRHEVLPKLVKINSKVEDALNSLSLVAESEQEIIEEYMGKIRKKILDNGKIMTGKFVELSDSVKKRFIYDFIKELKLDYDGKKIEEFFNFIVDNAGSKSGKTLSLTENLWLFCSSKEIYTVQDIKSFCDIEKELSGKALEVEFDNFIFTREKLEIIPDEFPRDTENSALVALDDAAGLVLRYRRSGDRIQPFGMKNTVKLKDFFINKGVPKHKKDKIVLLCSKNEDGHKSEVLWAVGVGISEKLRVSAESKSVYFLKLASKE